MRLGGYWANWTAARTANGWAERLAAMTALPKVSHLAYQMADHLVQQRAAQTEPTKAGSTVLMKDRWSALPLARSWDVLWAATAAHRSV